MRRIQKYSSFISLNEKVYLSNTIFNKYNLLVDPYSGVGHFNLDLKGGYHNIEMEIQSYGNLEDKQLIMRMPSKLSHLPERMSIFETVIKDVLHILNKNQLGFRFTINKIDKERGPLGEYAIIDLDQKMKMEDLERIAQMTKIVNSKVKDIGDFDKVIYKTNENNSKVRNILLKFYKKSIIDSKDICDSYPDLKDLVGVIRKLFKESSYYGTKYESEIEELKKSMETIHWGKSGQEIRSILSQTLSSYNSSKISFEKLINLCIDLISKNYNDKQILTFLL
ncbi:MAG: hypothetical protein SLAVMIC_00398 [uncultured marine phage]|uniref:Uncharacterized protein n=1 Tax=uncultured marine phage TaxID=707152 RepID=A0A8D9CCZ5_9VIRU|nr:MAG: hypothetical protein SLAVMIC_00398 [uncultured marine phage]